MGIVMMIFPIIAAAISAFFFFFSKKYVRKDAQTIAVISFIAVIIYIIARVVAYNCAISAATRIYDDFDSASSAAVAVGSSNLVIVQIISQMILFAIICLTVINAVFIIRIRKDKTVSSNKINESTLICPKCKKPISGNKNFCTSCGEKINTI